MLRWKATRTGVFVYHCIPGAMTPWHITSGMSGAVMVLPRDGLKDGAGKPLRYDRVYYVGEHDYYIPRDEKGKFKHYDTHGDAYRDTMEVMRKLVPSHVVFNGAVGALTGKNAMPAKVGETVLIVHSQASRDSRAHLVGGFGDYVWETGKFSNHPETDLETWFIRGGSAGAALTKFLQPGIVAYVNHNMIEAFELGATAHFRVEGQWNDDLMTQVKAPGPIQATSSRNDVTVIRTGAVGGREASCCPRSNSWPWPPQCWCSSRFRLSRPDMAQGQPHHVFCLRIWWSFGREHSASAPAVSSRGRGSQPRRRM